ncbi:hypothetical protein LPUS_09799 [Lasallia pustulata]|uniref:Uncharacterized protein n=1 Tax=Lasallia pustulata TaxID=136370 RepID=A0A1W5D847_9LECA|nr:hypothetical protein LPUS_09799 [Lasallia pustulata]
MASDAIAHLDQAAFSNSPTSYLSASPHAQIRNLAFPTDSENSGGSPTALEASVPDNDNGTSFGTMMRSMLSGSSYGMVESDGHDGGRDGDGARSTGRGRGSSDSSIDEHQRRSSPSERGPPHQLHLPKRAFRRTSIKTVSREGSIPMRHPTPDLQSLQGAYIGNVERLERSAERLSMSSDIGEELRKMRLEQKQADSRRNSRRSSMLDTHVEDEVSPPSRRDFTPNSNASNSILGVNNAARSGGYCPGGFAGSPRVSFHSGSWSHNSVRARSGSQRSRLTQMAEPEQEGRPLDSLLSQRPVPIISCPKPPVQVLRVTNHDEPLQDLPASDQEFDSTLQPPDSASHGLLESASEALERSTTSSVNTDPYRKANNPFADFDGVHITTPPPPPPPNQDASAGHTRQTPLGRLPIVPRPQSSAAPSGENMVFYPAPVPMTLNLPQKLSKLPPTSQRGERRSQQVLSNVYSDARQSTAWLPEVLENVAEVNPNDPNSISPKANVDNRKSIPPQLRATIFFEHPAIPQSIQVKENSAVATLDSILEASAYAPISAFIDHPIVGSIGAEIYSSSNARLSSGNMLGDRTEERKRSVVTNLPKPRRASSYIQTDIGRPDSSLLNDIAVQHPDMLDEAEAAAASGEHTPLRQATPGRDGPEEDGEFYDTRELFEGEDDYGHHPEQPEYNGPPTTLLAELQLRKLQQKQRNRTAATAFPNGMHSTLLELDAVAQVQKQTRRQKHITLAWEDPSTAYADAENEDDEDVPLGMLFPGRNVAAHENAGRTQPVGLIQRRDVDDNEPLSQRRARLRGEGPKPQREPSPGKRASVYTLDIPGLPATDRKAGPGVEEGETLAQRLKRLKGQADKQAIPINGDFASEVLGQLGGPPKPGNNDTSKDCTSQTPDPEEETLAQRRKRLQAAQKAHSRQVSSGSEPSPPFARPTTLQRRSTPDLLQPQPPTFSHPTPSYGIPPATTTTYNQPRAYGGGLLPPFPQPTTHSTAHRPLLPLQYSTGIPHPQFPTGCGGIGIPAFPSAAMTGMGMFQPEVPLDLKQRDMIDRWRQSVMH